MLSNWSNRFKRASKYTDTALKLHTQLVKQCIDIALQCVDPAQEKRPNVLNIIKILNASEGSYYVQNDKDLLVDHQVGYLKCIAPCLCSFLSLFHSIEIYLNMNMLFCGYS